MIRIEPFQAHQAEEVSLVILRNIREINSKDYPAAFVDLLVADFSSASMLEKAKRQFIFVAIDEGKIIGTGALENQGNPENPEYYLVAMFVLPEYHRQGIGRQLLSVVELKAIEIGAEKLTMRAAIGAPGFYQKMGYHCPKEGEKTDRWGNTILEKRL
jgi:GNAT superfamily N-acetyltransferase